MLEENAEDVKSLALYFDEINIIEQRHIHILAPEEDAKPVRQDGKLYYPAQVVSTNDFTDPRFLAHLKDFESSGQIKYKISADSPGGGPENNMRSISSDSQINDLILQHFEHIGKKHNETEKLDSEGRKIISFEMELNPESARVSGQLFNGDNNLYQLSLYYARVLKTFINYYEEGKDVTTTSRYVNDMFKVIKETDRFKKAQKAFRDEFKVNPSFAHEAIKLGLPNLGKFPPEEIMRFKENSKAELLAFRSSIETLTFDLLNNYDYDYITQNAQKIAELKMLPLIDKLCDSFGTSSFRLVQDLIKEARDPKSYTPLALTFSNQIPTTMILLVSCGIIGLSAAMDHYARQKEARKDGIYYLYKMRNYFS